MVSLVYLQWATDRRGMHVRTHATAHIRESWEGKAGRADRNGRRTGSRGHGTSRCCCYEATAARGGAITNGNPRIPGGPKSGSAGWDRRAAPRVSEVVLAVLRSRNAGKSVVEKWWSISRTSVDATVWTHRSDTIARAGDDSDLAEE
jgi:hypothetical protein